MRVAIGIAFAMFLTTVFFAVTLFWVRTHRVIDRWILQAPDGSILEFGTGSTSRPPLWYRAFYVGHFSGWDHPALTRHTTLHLLGPPDRREENIILGATPTKHCLWPTPTWLSKMGFASFYCIGHPFVYDFWTGRILASPPTRIEGSTPVRYWKIWIPMWGLEAFVLVAFTPLLVRWGKLARRAWRRRHRLCTSCGYDLRASPDRCPECGTHVNRRDRTQNGLKSSSISGVANGGGSTG